MNEQGPGASLVRGPVSVRRLGPADEAEARGAALLMAEVFEEPADVLSEEYLRALLNDPSFWFCTGTVDGVLVGGLSAHILPMTRRQGQELMIYDIAVKPDHQGVGIGRALMEFVRAEAVRVGISLVFAPAEQDDEKACGFYRALDGMESAVVHFDWNTTHSI